jgi:hypothetical protein
VDGRKFSVVELMREAPNYFALILAHELAHALGVMHNAAGDVRCGSGIMDESVR